MYLLCKCAVVNIKCTIANIECTITNLECSVASLYKVYIKVTILCLKCLPIIQI